MLLSASLAHPEDVRFEARFVAPSAPRNAPDNAIGFAPGPSFGLGSVPGAAEWHAMIEQGAGIGLQFWWYALAPGVAIMSVIMVLNVFGNGLRDALDPRRRGR